MGRLRAHRRPALTLGRAAPSRRLVRALALGVAVSVGVTLLSRVGALAGWETRAVDSFLFLRDRQPAPEIVLVTIDDDAFESLGERQPLPRRYLAELARFLLRSGARVVAFDLIMRAPTEEAADAALIEVARRAGDRLVVAALASPRPGPAGDRYEMAGAFSPALRVRLGFPNAPLGSDGLIRRMAPVLPAAGGGFLPSLPLVVLAAWDDAIAPAVLEAELRAGGDAALALPARGADGRVGREPITLAALAQGPWRVDFAGPPGVFPAFPSGPLVEMARRGVEPPADNPFRDRIVFVGATFGESRDFHATPVGLMAGVEIQAHMVHTLLGRRTIRPPRWGANLAVLIGACLVVSVLSLWLRPLWLALAALVVGSAFTVASYAAYVRGGYWLDFVGPLVAMVAYVQASRLLLRRRIRAAFGQYVSPEVLDRVLREGSDLGGELRTVSVLISDVRGFTALSEKLPPARVSEIMNEYFTAMVDVIMRHRGLVSDFIGDGMLAIFGAPLDDPAHAWHAVETAIGMHAALRRLNERWTAAGRPSLAMGVAVNTGEVFAGNVGSPRKKKYAALGDTVNSTARMEGLNRELGTEILISAATLALVADRVQVRDRGDVRVKGKVQMLAIFELEGLR